MSNIPHNCSLYWLTRNQFPLSREGTFYIPTVGSAGTKNMQKKKLIINYSDGSEYTIKNYNAFVIESDYSSMIVISMKARKQTIDNGIVYQIPEHKLTIKKHLVDSVVEIDYDYLGNKTTKETLIKGKSYFDKK